MNGFAIFLVLCFAPPLPMPPDLPPESLRVPSGTPKDATEKAFKELALPCPDQMHINEGYSAFGEGGRFCYRPSDMYEDCPDAMDLLVKMKEPIDERLIQLGSKGKGLPERYRAAWVLTRRGNQGVVPILEKMAASPSAEERYLAWHLYYEGVREKHLLAPRSFAAALDHCRKEKNRFVREQIMYFFGACRAKEAVPLLTAALKDDRDPNQRDAVRPLGEIRDPQTVPAIIEAAKKVTLDRDNYYCTLGKIGTPEAVDYLIQELDHGCFAIKALFETGSPRALPVLEKHLEKLKKKDKPDELDIATAHIAVLRLKHKDPRALLLGLAVDRGQSEWMRSHALQALEHYDAAPLAKLLLELYRQETDDTMRMLCIRVLRDLPGKEITEAMVHQALTDNIKEYHWSHDDLLEALNRRLNTSFKTLGPLVEYLRREWPVQEK
jgi:hypothetical protein